MIVPPGVWLLLVLTFFVAAVLRYHAVSDGTSSPSDPTNRPPASAACRSNRTKIFIFVFATFFAGIAGRVAVFLSEQPRRPHHRQRI